jgi:hypothetical protein
VLKKLKSLLVLFVLKEVIDMDVIYATLIVRGYKTFDEVPSVIQEDVKAVLIELGVGHLAEG